MEIMGFTEAYIHDTHGIMNNNHSKAYHRKLNKTSSGAFSYITFHQIEDPAKFLVDYPYRKIASVIHHEHNEIHRFQFQKNDLLLMGNETHGLDEETIHLCDHHIKIPQRGQTESFNLNVAATIFIYEYSRQLIFS